MAENKVQFGLKNVYYAPLTEGSVDGSTANSWATPVALPGAVTLTLSPAGEDLNFYADNVTYYKQFVNNGYTGDLEIARITEDFIEDILGETLEATTNILFEKAANAEATPFALLFEIDGDLNEDKYVLYRCVASRANIEAQTIGETKEPKTATLTIAAMPLVTGSATQKGLVKGRTTSSTPSATKSAWYSAVTVPAEPTQTE